MTVKFYSEDAAEMIAQYIDDETRKVEITERTHGRKRDIHRANSMIMAYRQALEAVLLERACKADGESHVLPSVDDYLRQRGQPAEPA